MSNPLASFAIEPVLSINLQVLGIGLTLTNHTFYLLVSLGLLLFVFTQTNKLLGSYLLPTNLGLIGESLHASLLAISRNTVGNQAMLPLLLSLFGLILFVNLISNVPYNYAVASSVTFSLGLSFTVFIGVTVLAISLKGWTFLATFVPAGTPAVLLPLLVVIELISYLARAVSLGVRLFANLVAGHTLLTIISTMSSQILTSSWYGPLLALVPVTLLTVLVGLELAVAFIQAYVFTILTAIYIDEAIKPLA